MKFRVSKKDMTSSYNTIISVSYCSLQYLLNCEVPMAYSAGVNGWSCDYYNIDGVIICEGYSPVNSKNAFPSYEINSLYNDKALVIIGTIYDYTQRKAALRVLINEYIQKVRGK